MRYYYRLGEYIRIKDTQSYELDRTLHNINLYPFMPEETERELVSLNSVFQPYLTIF